MRACILAAGIGQRLRPLTDDRPKALVRVGDHTFLERLISQLAHVGVSEIVVATGWHHDAVRDATRHAPVPVVLCRNPAFDSTQNSVSLHACRDALVTGGAQDTFKLDGDVIVDIDVFHRLLSKLRESRCDLAAAIDPHSPPATPLGAEEMKTAGSDDAITAFGKWLDPKEATGESIGVELIARSAVSPILDAVGALVTSGTTDLYYEDVYHRLLPKQGGTLAARAVRVGDLAWTEVDTQEDLSRAAEVARRARLK